MTREEEQIETNTQARKDDWDRLFKNVSDPDVIADNIRKVKAIERKENKRADTGL